MPEFEPNNRSPHGQSETLFSLFKMESLFALINAVPGVLWEAWGVPDAPSQRIDYVCDYVEEIVGYTVEEWLATPNFWLQLVHPEDKERAARETRAIYESGGAGMVAFRWVRRDGKTIWVEAYSTVIIGEEGKPVGMRGVTLDVTAKKEAELALIENQERIVTLFRRLRESILQTQDRIGNNLQFIASLIEEQLLEYEEAVPIAELRQVRMRLVMLAEVQTIVTESFREHDDMDHIPTHAVLEVLPDLFTLEARFRKLKIEADQVFLSAARVNSLAIIASELISNSYRYGKGVVSVELKRQNGEVSFIVCDEGEGFPKNFQPHESINTGLNLVKSMAWSGLMGSVTFENLPQGGACVTVKFPLHGR